MLTVEQTSLISIMPQWRHQRNYEEEKVERWIRRLIETITRIRDAGRIPEDFTWSNIICPYVWCTIVSTHARSLRNRLALVGIGSTTIRKMTVFWRSLNVTTIEPAARWIYHEQRRLPDCCSGQTVQPFGRLHPVMQEHICALAGLDDTVQYETIIRDVTQIGRLSATSVILDSVTDGEQSGDVNEAQRVAHELAQLRTDANESTQQ